MTIFYHGTPITPTAQMLRMAGAHFCVSFANRQQDDMAMEIASSVLWDNGAFTAHTKGKTVDEKKLFEWLTPRVKHPHRAVVWDAIGGDVEAQRAMRRRWPFPKDLSWPVWHLHLPLDYLEELADEYGAVCLGSSAEFWEIGSLKWQSRMDAVYTRLLRRRYLPWIHGLRMASQVHNYPFSSVDSTNVAQNWHRTGCAACKARHLQRATFSE